MRSSIFLDSITCIDHAVLTKDGVIVGGSYMLSVIVSGEIPDDDPEQVVIDFSKCKKLIKACVDDQTNGFDHKLWIDRKLCKIIDQDDKVEIKTKASELILPLDAIKYIDYDNVFEQINNEIQKYLSEYYPQINISTISTLSNRSESILPTNSIRRYFNYVHGLKSSSSYGCQNIAHGHTSYFEFETTNSNITIPDYSNVIFVFRENFLENAKWIMIEYHTLDRGFFSFSINKDAYKKHNIEIRVIPTETTIEHLIDVVEQDFKEDIKYLKYLRVSEGLQKGAVKFY